jgi:F-type H+-transporting ATPase subunit gamma
MLGVDAPFSDVQDITRAVVELYTRSEEPVGEVYIVYTEFKNAVTQIPHVDRFLPIETAAVASEGEAPVADIEFEYEPSAGALLDVLIPRFVDNQVYQYLLESIASEYGARMTAMSTASDNARDMISTLTIAYNRARQDAITKELLDIVGGAEALSGE